MTKVSAKPLEWSEDSSIGAIDRNWTDSRMRFGINFTADDDDDVPYTAWWGECDSESFATLEEAKQWCQEQADDFIRENTHVET